MRLSGLRVYNATQRNVLGSKNWAAIKRKSGHVVVRAVTAPRNTVDEWKQIRWTGAKPKANRPNECELSLRVSKKHHVQAQIGETSDYVDVWIIWSKIEILTKGPRPRNSAPFESQTKDHTQNLGAVTYPTFWSSIIDEATGDAVKDMGASAKVAPVATLSPTAIRQIITKGWAFKREVWSHVYADSKEFEKTTRTWTDDTSKPQYLRLVPDERDRIYDLDAPDIQWGLKTFEVYHNFRQWIEWNDEKCSDYAPWYWRARWRLNKDVSKQITLNDLGRGNISLPKRAYYPPK